MVSAEEKWANRIQTSEILGVSLHAISLLARDNKLKPDCITCGRIRWLRSELAQRRQELRDHLRSRYPDKTDELIIEDEDAKIGVSGTG
jgi:hypothetical protein